MYAVESYFLLSFVICVVDSYSIPSSFSCTCLLSSLVAFVLCSYSFSYNIAFVLCSCYLWQWYNLLFLAFTCMIQHASNFYFYVSTFYCLQCDSAGWIHCDILSAQWKPRLSKNGYKCCAKWHNRAEWNLPMLGTNNGTYFLSKFQYFRFLFSSAVVTISFCWEFLFLSTLPKNNTYYNMKMFYSLTLTSCCTRNRCLCMYQASISWFLFYNFKIVSCWRASYGNGFNGLFLRQWLIEASILKLHYKKMELVDIEFSCWEWHQLDAFLD